MKKLSIFFVLCFCSSFLLAQDYTNKAELLKFAEEMRIQQEQAKQEAETKANNYRGIMAMPIRQELEGGGVMELMAWPDGGMPMYYITNNASAAKTISTNKVHLNGGAGYSLDGSGVLLGEWDGGHSRVTHQEFNETGSTRITVKDTGAEHYHAIHVSGTMVASGYVSSAKGMSPAADLHSYEWTNDASEMAAAAANDDLRVSNHSYGYSAGWRWDSGGNVWYWYGDVDVSTTEAYDFGLYSSYTQNWDIVANNAPYYLICKSAGNDRGEGPASGTSHYYYNPTNSAWELSTATREKDGGTDAYDCIGMQGCAKNIMTVGAVSDIVSGWTQPSDVVMSSFSCWGPTDDGRIKPDIVANGITLYSAFQNADDAYASLNGTSMSTPTVTGSIGLLLEHRRNLVGTGHDYLSSTIKGLICHTADEAGSNDGPDYAYGWGLMNTRSCIDMMSDNDDLGSDFYIQELELTNGGTISINGIADGTESIKVTICWNDPYGTPVTSSPLNNRTKMLVNDLDVKIMKGATTTQAWVLDPDSPATAPTRGDNDVDNVEQVFIKTPTAGEYKISINHEGTLAANQKFSLLITGLAPNNIKPKSGCEDVTLYPAIMWNSITDAVKYNMNIATDVAFNNVVLDVEIDDMSYNLNYPLLHANTTYYWRVRGKKSNDTYTSWESTCNFKTSNNVVATIETKATLDLLLQGVYNGSSMLATPALVQARTGSDILTSTLVTTAPGIIQSNGTLEVTFGTALTSNDYWLIVNVPGYLPLATVNRQSLTQGSDSFGYNFKTNTANAYYGTTVLIQSGSNYLLRAGDLNYDYQIENLDNNVLQLFGGKSYKTIFER